MKKRVKLGVVGLVCLAIAIINPLPENAWDQIVAGIGGAVTILQLMKDKL